MTRSEKKHQLINDILEKLNKSDFSTVAKLFAMKKSLPKLTYKELRILNILLTSF